MTNHAGEGAAERRAGRRVKRIAAAAAVAAVALLAPAWFLLKPGRDTRPDVVLVVIDALRPDRLSCCGGKPGVSPNIDALAAEGLVFLDNKAQAGMTVVSMAALFTSRFTDATALGRPGGAGDRVFAEVLKDAGYLTVGVQTNPWLTARMQFTRGFDDYRVLTPAKNIDNLKAAAWDEDVAENVFYADAARAAAECANAVGPLSAGSPLFLYVHLMDAHAPYIPPERFQSFGTRRYSMGEAAALSGKWVNMTRGGDMTGLEEVRAEILSLYDAEVAYADWAVGEIMKALEERGKRDNSIVIIAADHGEGFYEHGQVLHANSLYEELLRTPLLMKIPGRAAARHEGLTRNVDIAPTVFEAAGIAPGWGRREGVSLLGALDGRTAILESAAKMSVAMGGGIGRFSALQYGGYKVVSSETPWQSLKSVLFDLRKDPGETTDISAEAPERKAALLARLEQIYAAEGSAPEAPLDPETERRLKALGYLQGE